MRPAEAAKQGVFLPFGGVFTVWTRSSVRNSRRIARTSRSRYGPRNGRNCSSSNPGRIRHSSWSLWADRPGAQLARNPATGDDKSLGAATARRAHGNGNPCAIEIATATAAAITAALPRRAAGLLRRAGFEGSTERGASREPDSDFSSLPMLPPALPDCASAALATAAETKSETSVIPIVR